ncbi:STAS domain-containing protein [Amycolatopsis sp. FDAARGOS 1241]|uniref:STAS domain-containing protein n=1 Tax=Amycolatopsis sp. FDAARGOS 1241 TaxID=2778070 RepID=UPI00194EE06D|nr:STAS domain-containing protein [Amycolatopsis sp. FDAARGOS 1241]QRP42813.1 anti-sigma factor antagonist [Amycolatopsis sp. FDAARGOS 1241]
MQPSDHADPVSAAPAADVALRHSGEDVVIVAGGEFDAITSPTLQKTVHHALAEKPTVLVLDLTGAVFFSSVAIGVLVDAVLTAGEHTTVRLVVARPIRRTLQLLGMDHYFDYYDTTQDALTARPT